MAVGVAAVLIIPATEAAVAAAAVAEPAAGVVREVPAATANLAAWAVGAAAGPVEPLSSSVPW